MYKGDQRLLLFLSEFLFFFAWFPLSPSLVSPHYPLLPIHVNKCPFTFSSNLTWSYSNIYMQKPTYLYACILYKEIILYMLFTQQLQYWSLQASFHGLDPFFQMAIDHSLI